MRRIDALHMDYPFAGSRMLRDLLRGEGVVTGREHATTMTRLMRIEPLYRRPNPSKPAAGHKIYPYLLRGLAVDRPNLHPDGPRLCLPHGGGGLVHLAGWRQARAAPAHTGRRAAPAKAATSASHGKRSARIGGLRY